MPVLSSLLLLALGAVWTVDDDGPADFPSVSAAVSSPLVQDGDLVLVAPGSFGPFDLTRPLAIVGTGSGAPPLVQGTVRVSCDSFALAHLSFAALEIGPAGSGVLESVSAQGASAGAGRSALLVHDTERLLVSRCSLFGAFDFAGDGGAAIEATNSRLVLAETLALGGDGALSGGDGVRATKSSTISFAGGALLGGSGASAGAGLTLVDSHADLRGRSQDAVLEGLGSGAASVALVGASTLLFSPEITLKAVASLDPAAQVILHAPHAPLLRHAGADVLGGSGKISLEGPPGSPALLLLSESDAFVEVPELADPLWIDPADLVFAVWTAPGSNGRTEVPYSVPAAAGLAGRGFRFQAAFPLASAPDRPLLSLATPPVEVRPRP